MLSRSLLLFAVASSLAACGGVEESPGGDAGTVLAADASTAPPACTTASDCPLITDCRCKDGSRWEGRGCTNGACLDRRHKCDDMCAEHSGWTPNPEGCWEWELVATNGTAGADFSVWDYSAGCQSGARMRVWRPSKYTPYDLQSWCVPASSCQSDADCAASTPLTASGKQLPCSPAVTSPTTGKELHLCFWSEWTLCGVWGR